MEKSTNKISKLNKFIHNGTTDSFGSILFAFVMLAIGIAIGAITLRSGHSVSIDAKLKDLTAQYLGEVEFDEELAENLYLEALVKSLGDKYTYYKFGDEAESLENMIDGEICGIFIAAAYQNLIE